MNLESVSDLREGTHDSGTQESSSRQNSELVGACLQPEDICVLNLPAHRLHSYSLQHPCVYLGDSSDWETSAVLRARELEEIKARATQMEKTMRWWSDCTANWREKWSKVRTERNKAREEIRELRLKLEMVMKELSALKKEKQDLINEKELLKAEITWKRKIDFLETCHKEQIFQRGSPQEMSVNNVIKNKQIPSIRETSRTDMDITENPLTENQDMRCQLELPDLFSKGVSHISLESMKLRLDSVVQPLENELMKMSILQLHIDESPKTVQKEREVSNCTEMQIGMLASDLSQWSLKYEETSNSKQETVKQLERLQVENTAEWEKKEILGTENVELERENRRLKTQIGVLQELLATKNGLTTSTLETDFERAKNELLEKNKLDDSLNQIRKLQQSLEKETEAKDSLQVQVNHLQSRLKEVQKVSSVPNVNQQSICCSRDSPERVDEDEVVDSQFHRRHLKEQV
ncbi:coiled-coil domain-containing protein 102B isoform X1 [Microcaecilia unicolor]|uniref:Coiled-coil domain-containing protein 102B isoform X1 n=1 Tax=Microcaecilia unicolor TaxID=1415580 RepID=A0A6P7YMD9_9AMPH|nr:coiled-coil domain-containing protein 102B isoform X1 [Microcaecilia unicolor]